MKTKYTKFPVAGINIAGKIQVRTVSPTEMKAAGSMQPRETKKFRFYTRTEQRVMDGGLQLIDVFIDRNFQL